MNPRLTGVVAAAWAVLTLVFAVGVALQPSSSPSSAAPGPVVTTTTATTRPPAPSLRGNILFTSAGSNLWVMGADGSDRRAITHAGRDAQPSLSPGGRRIAWVVDRTQVWTMATDGSGATQVASCPRECGFPVWSPGGGRIAYTTTDGENGDVVVIDADGSRPRRYATPIDASRVGWSPDGMQLAVAASGAPNDAGLYVMDVASGTERRIRTGSSRSPAWSPDGKVILFSDTTTLFTIAPDGTGLRPLASGPGQYLSGAWSPDGRTIAYAYSAGRGELKPQIGVMSADGSSPRLITTGAAADDEATF